ncbi:hypothetical protein PV367_22950 [Streptomyces europaeiscabiei]|uniref:Uncharacterized protein n=1 Tax=Streptomyces europaeiscabiei TaxID=146819 RepID=A0AAJ2UMK7_9ACTN|nr:MULTISPECIES: hypothetical protein [Streptomyces]MDX3132583.1 hypothetical protein [Streptomyces europaeiscabiei]
MVTSTVHGAPAVPSGGPPARHTGTVIAGCLAIRPAWIHPAPTEAEESAA